MSAINARATYGAKISVDEPQYLLTALSIAEDFDLDISDELDETLPAIPRTPTKSTNDRPK